MFSSPTVFVLGAGASCEAGFPLGSELAAKISELVNFRFEGGRTLVSGDAGLYSTLETRFGSNANEYRRAGVFVAGGIQLADSIDDFLSLHQADSLITTVGKLGIAKAILTAERKSKMYPQGLPGKEAVNFKKLNETWYVKLLKILSRETAKEQVGDIFRNVAFINFNYDRSLEFFFWRGLQLLYGINASDAAKIVSKMRVFRPYGFIGQLDMGPDNPGVEFGADDADCTEISVRIKTYSEKVREDDELRSLRDEVINSKLIVFLGMHFHEQNLKIITPSGRTKVTNIFATAYGLSPEDRSVVEERLQVFLSKKFRDGVFLVGDSPVRLSDISCSGLFSQYSKTLPNPTELEPHSFGVP
jgi:hypothetical protein